jgi:hypothetical protein
MPAVPFRFSEPQRLSLAEEALSRTPSASSLEALRASPRVWAILERAVDDGWGAPKAQAGQTMVLAWQALAAEARQGGDQMAAVSAIGAIGYMIRARGLQEAVRDAAATRRDVLPSLPLGDFGPDRPLSPAELTVQGRALAAVSGGDALLDGMPVPQIERAIRTGARVVSEGGPDAARRLAALGAQLDIDGASPLREGQARIAHQVIETMADQAGIGISYRNALLGARFARGLAAEASRPEEAMPFLRSFIGAVAQEVGLSPARQAAVQGEGALGQTVRGVAREVLDAAARDDVRVLVRGHLAVQKDLTGADRIDGGRMVGGMSKVRGVAERVAEGVRDAIRATGDAARRLVGTER